MKDKRIFVAGGTGFIGQAIVRHFAKGNEVVIVSRNATPSSTNSYSNQLLTAADGYKVTYWRWDGTRIEKHWLQSLDGADLLINLCGKSVNCRYTEKNKKEVLDSRISTTRLLSEAVSSCKKPPSLWINASSATIYQHSTDYPNDEFTGRISELKKNNMPYSALDRLRFYCKKKYRELKSGRESVTVKDLPLDFSVKVCKAWEGEFFRETLPSTRKIALRMAIAIGEGGVLVPLKRLARLGLGGHQGDGKQLFSWIHITDLLNIMDWCASNNEITGVINAASPNAISNKQLMTLIRNSVGAKIGIPAPASLLELGAILIGTETELILKSRWVVPARLQKHGFVFTYPVLEEVLPSLLKNGT